MESRRDISDTSVSLLVYDFTCGNVYNIIIADIFCEGKFSPKLHNIDISCSRFIFARVVNKQ